MKSVNHPPVDKQNPIFKSLRSLFGQRSDILLIAIAGLLLVALCIYMVKVWKPNNPSILFSPGDVVYGQPLVARHRMGAEATQTDSVSAVVRGNGIPQIQTSENYYDFGEINASQVITRTFVIANQGSDLLIISRAYTTCGCTTADFTASEIPPGKVALMVLRFDPAYHKLHGTTVRRGVLIETNDPDHPTQEIWIQASVR